MCFRFDMMRIRREMLSYVNSRTDYSTTTWSSTRIRNTGKMAEVYKQSDARMSDRQNSCICMHRPMHTGTIPGSIAAGPGDLSGMHMHTAVRSEFTAQYGNPRSCNIYPIIASSSTFALTPAAPLSTTSTYRYPVHYSQIL